MIQALRVKTPESPEFKVWKFSQSQHPYQCIHAVVASPYEHQLMIAAFNWVLFGHPSKSLSAAAIQLNDETGHSWIIEAHENGRRYFKDNTPVENELLAETMIASILHSEHAQLSELQAQILNLTIEGAHFTAEPQSEHYKSQAQDELERLIKDEKNQLATKLGKLLGIPAHLAEQKSVLDMLEQLRPLYFNIQELEKQKKGLLQNTQSVDKWPSDVMDRLEKEIAILQKLETLAAPLLEPAHTPKIIREKLDKTNAELKKLTHALNIQELPEVAGQKGAQIPWSKIINTLVKKKIYQQLVELAQQAQVIYEDKIEPIHQSYLKTLDELVTGDQQITAELESCLTTLTLQTEKLELTQKHSRLGLWSLIQKFIEPSEKHSDPELVKREQKKKLDESRMAIDFTLARLGELHASILEARELFEDMQQKLSENFDHIVSEYGRIKNYWIKICQDYRIKEESSINDIIILASHYGQLFELTQTKQKLLSSLQERKQAQEQIEQLIIEWRQVSGSQKYSELTNPAILLAEVQGILRYKEKKEAMLAKAKDIELKLKSFHTLKTNLEGRLSQIQLLWKDAVAKVNIKEWGINHYEWPRIFEYAQKVKAWQTLATKKIKPLENAEIFSYQYINHPFTIMICHKNKLSATEKLTLTQLLENHELKHPVILMMSDLSLADLFQQIHLSQARPAPVKKKPHATASSTPSKIAQAEALVKLLNGRR